MSLFKICKGAETNLPQTLTNGYCYFCTDTANFYIDYTDTYGALTRSKISAKYADKLRYTEDGNFVEIEPADVLTKNNYEAAIGVAATDKNGLMSSADKTKLDGIADGAEVNVQPDWNQNDETAADYVKNRPGGYYGDMVMVEEELYSGEIMNKFMELGVDFLLVAGQTYKVTIGGVDETYTAFADTYQGISGVTIGDAPFMDAYTSGGGVWALFSAEVGGFKGALIISLEEDVGKAIRIARFGIGREVHKIPAELLDMSGIDERIQQTNAEFGELSKKHTSDISAINKILSEGPIIFEKGATTITLGKYKNVDSGYMLQVDRGDGSYASVNYNGLYVKNVITNIDIGVNSQSIYIVETVYNSGIRLDLEKSANDGNGGTRISLGNVAGDDTTFYASGKIINNNKIIGFTRTANITEDNATTLRGVKTPEQDYDAANKKYVDDLVPSEATTSASGLMSATDKVKLDGVASSAASVTIKTWTTADMV